MFCLTTINKLFNKGSLRLGYYLKAGKKISTPCYFLISNFGGGGTNVSRFVTYMHIFEKGESQLLLNYYYLNTDFEKTPGFDIKTLSTLKQNDDIVDFLKEVRKEFIRKKKVIPEYSLNQTIWNPEIILDSGSGNIFRDLIKHGKLSTKTFNEAYTAAIKGYIAFGLKHRFDILIAMDIAKKYTFKGGEHNDTAYHSNLDVFRNSKNNIELLKITLENLPNQNQLMMFAPIHGKTPKEYEEYLELILKVEREVGKKFAGFAIGGLDRNRAHSYEVCALIRDRLSNVKDDRPIHVLGVGSLQNLIPMCLLGIDSFDCHSPWRRASDPGGKFVIPLVNSRGKVITKKADFWKYVPIAKYKEEDFNCDCEVCKKYTLSELRSMYLGDGEHKYFAEILFFKHNISQQEFVLKGIREGGVKDLITNMPESTYKRRLEGFIHTLG